MIYHKLETSDPSVVNLKIIEDISIYLNQGVQRIINVIVSKVGKPDFYF